MPRAHAGPAGTGACHIVCCTLMITPVTCRGRVVGRGAPHGVTTGFCAALSARRTQNKTALPGTNMRPSAPSPRNLRQETAHDVGGVTPARTCGRGAHRQGIVRRHRYTRGSGPHAHSAALTRWVRRGEVTSTIQSSLGGGVCAPSVDLPQASFLYNCTLTGSRRGICVIARWFCALLGSTGLVRHERGWWPAYGATCSSHDFRASVGGLARPTLPCFRCARCSPTGQDTNLACHINFLFYLPTFRAVSLHVSAATPDHHSCATTTSVVFRTWAPCFSARLCGFLAAASRGHCPPSPTSELHSPVALLASSTHS